MLQGADTNGDGALDAQELQAVTKRMSERRGRGYGASRDRIGQPQSQPPQQP
jgi:hypothetical protein